MAAETLMAAKAPSGPTKSVADKVAVTDVEAIEPGQHEDPSRPADPDRAAGRRAARSADDDETFDTSRLPVEGIGDERRQEIIDAVRRDRKGTKNASENPDDDEEAPDEATIVRARDEDQQIEGEAGKVDNDAPPAKPTLSGKQPAKTDQAARQEMAQAARKIGLDELDDDVRLEITVNGHAVETTVGDLLANAGKFMAGDEHLASAKEVLRTARVRQDFPDDTRDEPRQPARQSDGSRPADRVVATPAIDKDRLRTIVDTIQGGTVEEATEALGDLLSESATIAARAAKDVTEGDRNETRLRSVIGDALTRTAERYPEINSDQRLVGITAATMNEKMKDALRGIDIAEADQLDTMPPMQLIRDYTLFREQNPTYALPDLRTLFNESAGETYEWKFGEKKTFDNDDDGQRQPADRGQDDRRADNDRGSRGSERHEPREPSSRAGNGTDHVPVRRTGVRVVRKETLTAQPRPASIRADSAPAPTVSRETRHEIAIERMRNDRQGVAIRR
jgi:hypothetical protein